MKVLTIIFLLCLPYFAHSIFKKGTILFGLNLIKSRLERIISKSVGNTECAKDLKALVTDLYGQKLWALQMIDANIKVNPGILLGNIYQFGNYDECIAINVNRSDDGNVIKGQYCSLVLHPKFNWTTSPLLELLDPSKAATYLGYNISVHHGDLLKHFRLIFGVCMPRSCSISHLENIWAHLETIIELPVQAVFKDFLCHYDGKPIQPYAVDIFILSFFGIILAIVLLSTIYDLFLSPEDRDDDLLVIFSLYTNSKKLLSVHCENNTLTCMYGLKVCSIFWIILGHRYLFNVYTANTNALYALKWKTEWKNTFVVAAPLAVDTFLTISGILICYVKLQMSKDFRISTLAFYGHRIIRLGPALAATVLFYISVIKFLADGPFWEIIVKKIAGSCYYTWWATLGFLTNFVGIKYQCIEQTWYLGVDSQLYLFSPLILNNIVRHSKRTIVIMVILCITSVTYSYYFTIKYNISALLNDVNNDFLNYIYFSPIARAPAWLIGILVGYIIHKHQHSSVKMSDFFHIFMTSVSLSIMLGLVLSHILLTKYKYNATISAIFNSIIKPVWAMCIGSLIYSCSAGHIRIINGILSSRIFIVLGKLTYSMYLVHVGVLLVLAGSQKQASYFSNTKTIHDFFGDVIITLICSAILCLLFESPVFAFLNIMKRRTLKYQATKLINKGKVDKGTATDGVSNVLWALSIIARKKKA